MDVRAEPQAILASLTQAAGHFKAKDKTGLAAVNAIIADQSKWTESTLKLSLRRLLQPTDAVERLRGSPHLLVGRRLLIFWPGDEQWYPGRVGAYAEQGPVPVDVEDVPALMHRIDYDDGESYQHDLREAAFRFES